MKGLVGARLLCLVLVGSIAGAADYKVYSLPTSSSIKIPRSKISYKGKRIKIKGTKVRVKKPSVDASEYLFAKQAYVSEKRDQAIKLLRQERASGYKRNLDNILLRLGQLYTEKYMELTFLENQYYNEKLKEYENAKNKKKRKAPKLSHARSRKYLNDALKQFTELERKYPKHRRMDEVVFFIGFVNMEFGRTKRGIKYLQRVIRQYPRSSKYVEAVLYLADYYFDKGQFSKARANYRTILKKKNSELYHYALYKNAWCELNLNAPSRGLRDMKKLVELLDDVEGKENFNLKEQAMRDLVVFFAELEKVDEAIAYFEDKMGREQALNNLKAIAAALLAKNKDKSALKAYLLLKEEFGDSLEGPDYYLALYDSRVRLGQYNKAIDTMVEAIERYGSESDWYEKHEKKEPRKLKSQVSLLQEEGRNAAYFYHRTAQKTKGKANYRAALRIYSALVKSYPKIEDRRKLTFYQAEILYQQRKWLESANIYMSIARTPPKDKLAEESLYNALLALDNLTQSATKLKRYTKEEMKKMKFEKEDIPEGEQKFIDVANQYLKQFPKAKRGVDVRFRIASIYYKHKHFDKALTYFQNIALNHPRHKSARTAAYVSLDIYNIKKDYKGLDKAASMFAAKKGLSNKKFRQEMVGLRNEITFKEIEGLEASKKWEEAGDSYSRFYRKNSRGSLARQSLYNAVISYEKSGNKKKFSEASALFLRKYPSDPYSKRLLLKQAKTAEERLEFSKSQTLYRRYHEKYPKDAQSVSALYNAAVFAEITAKHSTANRLYKKYLQVGKPNREERKQVLLTQAKIYAKRNYWTKVGEAYAVLVREARGNKEKALLLSDQADLYEQYNRRKDRNYTLSKIKKLTGNRGGVERWGAAVRYVAENRFNAVAPLKRKFDRVGLRFPVGTLVARIKSKQRALVKLSAGYDEVVNIGVPNWGVAALHDKADAYLRFVAAYRKLKVPRNYKAEQRKQLETELKQLDTQLIAPLETKAKEILSACVQKASEFHVVNDYVAKCHRKANKEIAATRPSGLIPQPAYWTTRWVR